MNAQRVNIVHSLLEFSNETFIFCIEYFFSFGDASLGTFIDSLYSYLNEEQSGAHNHHRHQFVEAASQC